MTVSKIFRQFIPQLLHMIVLPVFFFAFMLIYHPFGEDNFLGNEFFGVHTTIIACIILVSIVITRLLYYFLPMNLNYTLYAFWCLGEVIFIAFFAALYIWLVRHHHMPYLEVFLIAFKDTSFILAFPYVLLALSMRISEYNRRASEPENDGTHRMRFYDEKHNLKLVLMAETILYIGAEENYVNIFYLENDKVRKYVLRSSMKAIDELCQDNGLMRCHRSFYINPSHIKVLRKEKEGVVYAELDAADVRHIPVTKKYYGVLSELLY